MYSFFKSKFNVWREQKPPKTIGNTPEQYTVLKTNLIDNMIYFQGQFTSCADFITRELNSGGLRCQILYIDNMVDKITLTESVLNPLMRSVMPQNIQPVTDKVKWLHDNVLASPDQKEVHTYEECMQLLMSGFVVILFEGYDKAVSVGLQSFPYRSVAEPNIETVLRGSREGFVEPLHLNLSIVRRRCKNSNMKFETFTLGNESKTDVCLLYIGGVVQESVLNEVRKRLFSINMDMVLASGYLQTYFQDHPFSIFSTVGTTERPDTLCGKLNEGRVGIIVDGTPLALYTPFLFVENFQNMDDYAVGTYYASFTRILKFLSFFISSLLPGLYVAIGSFHPTLLPSPLLRTLAQAEETTPFTLFIEALVMQIIYELLRESGLRVPKQFGFAINIVGAMIIGQAAVQANLIGAPMVIIIALTAITSLVIPSLYEAGVVMRFLFIFLAAMSGLYGVTLGIAFIGYHICSIKTYEIPFSAPVLPFELFPMRDVLFRFPWKILSRKKMEVQDMPGSNVDQNQNL